MHKKIYPLVFLLVCFAPLYTHATVLKVTSLADAGAGTLRDQINLANAGDTVLIDVKGTINLNSQINVPGGKNVTVIGPYPIHCTINVSAVAFGSAFDVATGATFNLMGVAIKGSTSGANGYFISDGNCLIRDCLFESNTSSANGGAINNSFNGFIRVENSSFIDNTLAAGSSGGAIFNNNDMVLVNCTFYGNSATTGGAIFNNTATASLELLHCTFDNNQAYGGVGNGNAIYNNGGTVGIQNCIVVHSGAGAAFADMFGSSGGTWTSHGGNIIRRNPGGFLSASGSDITNSTFSSVDPNFRTGGPLTDGYGLKYLKINPGSNAIDKGIIPGVASAIPPIDCRRAPRTIHGGSSLMPDAGAVEYTAYTVTSAAGFTTQWAAMIASIVPGPRYMDFDHIGPITIPVGSAFTFAATEPWMIDGYSQPGTAVPGPGVPGTYITPAVFYTKLQGTSASDIFNLSAWPNSSWIAGLDFEVGSGRIGIRMTNCNIRIYGNNFNTPSNDGNNGIQSSGASNVVNIGGKFVHECNVIGGQKNGMPNSAGIYIKNSIFGFIGGNLIGTTPDGTGARANEVGIIVENCDSAVVIGGHIDKRSSNVISGNTTAQIVVQLGGGCQIYGNKIGPSISGDAVIAASNYGVHFKPGTSGYIGKAISGYGNTIGGAINDGIRLEGTFDVKVLANYIGLSRNAATTYPALPNGTGINILNSGAVSNQIGNGTYSGRNYICKNSAVGIYMDLANNTKIKNNFIGVGPDNAAAGNGPMAIHLINGSFSNIIEHNVIGDHTSAGVWLNGAGNGNLILNNKIGTDSSGLFSRSNNTGVLVQNSGDNTVIKGNLVSGNTTGSGIELVGNFSLATISMNVIGLNSSQTSVLANIVGVKVLGCSLVDIDTNIISGNSQDGVLIDNTTNFNVRSNRIGLSSADVPYPNLLLGVFVLNGAANGMIGGAGGEGNIISGNSQTGVLVQPTCSGIGILGNKMSNNGGIGISLGNGGGWTPLPNDLNDVDDLTSYGNNGQNYPVITSAFVCSVSSQTNLSGTINVDNPTGVYRLEFFAIVPPATADPTGFGEGDSLIGNMTIVSPGSSASWAFPFGGIFPAGTRFTATLSEDIGGGKYETSEFSAAFTLGTFSAAATVVANATCSNSADGSATVSVIGATPTAFQWYTASGTPVAGATALTATGLLPGSYFCEVTESGGCNLNSDTVTITAPAPLNFTPNVLNETCAGYADGSIELVLNSGETAPFTIDAYNSSSVPAGSNSGVMYAATSTIPGLAADVYTVLVTDVNGCDDTLILTVAAGPDLTASFTTFGSFCENSPISFSDASAGTALPASGWTWDFGDAAGSNLQNPSHTYTSSGAFTVELIVTAGTCTDTATSVINIIAGPVVNAGIDDTMCVGGTYLLDGSASDAGSYNWYVLGSGTSFSTSATTVVNPASNTSYVFEVYNGTCTNTDTMNLVVTTGTDPTFSYGATNYCASVAGPVAPSFTASAGGYFDVVGGTGVTINTTTGEIFPSASVPGTYQIYHSYTSPCFIADTVTITINPLPAVTVTPDHFICYGDTATFVGTPAGGTWSGVIGLNATSGVWITWLATTNTYHTITYTYTDATTGCTNTDTNNIWLNALPPVSITGLTAGPYCVSEGPIVATGVPGGGAFLLNGTFVSGSPYNYDPTTVGTDTVAYLYVDPVTTCVNYTQVNVVVANDPVAPILGSTPPFDYCGTSPGTVTVSNPLGTEWYTDNGLTNLIATGGTVSTASFPGGTHTLYIVNTVGANCVSAPLLFTYTNYDASLITMNEPYQTCSGEPIQLNPVLGTGLSFVQWVPDTTMNDNTVLAPFVGPSVTHTYYIIVDVPALPGCTLYDSVRVDVQPCSLENITNAFSPDGDGVNDSWIINGIGSHPQNTVTVFNRWGDKMVQIDGYDNVTKVWDGKYNGSLVAAGTYYFIVQYFDDGQQKAGWIQVNY